MRGCSLLDTQLQKTLGSTDAGVPFSLDHAWHAPPNLPAIFADSAIVTLRLGAAAIFVIRRQS